MGLTQVNSGGIEDGSIVNADIKSDSAIALSKLASTPAVLTGSTNNTIATVTGANAIQGEANLTFDGAGQLAITGDGAGDGLSITNNGDHYTELSMDADRGSASNALGIIQGKWNNNSVCSIYLQSGADTSNKDDGQIAFNTSAASSSQATRMVVKNNGDVEINDGNLVIGTGGHGIDFSAHADAGGMTSETLDHYEEGTWTATYGGATTDPTCTYDNQSGVYVKVGRLVTVHVRIRTDSVSGGSGHLRIKGFPFATAAAPSGCFGGYITFTGNWSSNNAPSIINMGSSSTHATLYNREDGNEDPTVMNVNHLNTTGDDNDIRFTAVYRTLT